MAIIQEIRCDFCAAVLVGMKGRVKVSKSYLEIAGFVRDWQADPDSGWRESTYISHPDKRQMSFCTDEGATCLQDYVQMKRDSNRVRREQLLREGATRDQDGFVVGRKSGY
jgi:hypothetical protein